MKNVIKLRFKPKLSHMPTIDMYMHAARLQMLMKIYQDTVDFYHLLQPNDQAKIDEIEREINHILINMDHCAKQNKKEALGQL